MPVEADDGSDDARVLACMDPIRNSATLCDGVPKEVEERQLAFAIDLIAESGQYLRLPQVVVTSAKILFHRFFMLMSLKEFSHVWIACGALLVATKAGEEERRVRDVVNVVHFSFCKRQRLGARDAAGLPRPLNYYGEAGYLWKTNVVIAERALLRDLGFRVLVETPHRFLLVFWTTLRDNAGPDARAAPAWLRARQTAWTVANSVYRLRLPSLYSAQAVACGCISVAMVRHGVALPDRWEAVFGGSPDVSELIRVLLAKCVALGETAGMFEDLADSDVLEACRL